MEEVKFADLPRGVESILFVDGNSNVARICRLLLESLGYMVTAQNCPKAALEKFSKDPIRFDLAITELDLQPLTGDKLAEALYRIRPDFPVIAHTARLAPVYQKAFRGLVRKPTSFMEMATAIRQVLDNTFNPTSRQSSRS